MKTTYRAIALVLLLGGVHFATAPGQAQPTSPLDGYRKLKYRPTIENFDKGWQERVLVEFDIVNTPDLEALRVGLKDRDPFIRSIAAHALGIRGDKASVEALAELVKTDPEAMVRGRAVESLGLLKMKPEAIAQAEKDASPAVRWVARMAAGQLRSDIDCRGPIERAYAAGIQRDKLASAKVGQKAPDFAAVTSDGEPFKLSTFLGKKPILLYFAAVDA